MGVHAAFKIQHPDAGLLSVATSPSLAFAFAAFASSYAFSSALCATVFADVSPSARGQFFFHLLILFAEIVDP